MIGFGSNVSMDYRNLCDREGMMLTRNFVYHADGAAEKSSSNHLKLFSIFSET